MVLIDGGYIIVARKMFEGELMDSPPLHLKLWVWMLNEANWKDRGKIKRGQLLTSIQEMREAMSYKVGYRKKTPTIGQIRSAYEAFTNNTMISTAKTTRGMLITILNFDKYQDPKNYEQHNGQHNEKPTNNTVATQDMEEGEEREYKSTLTGTCPQAAPDGPPPCPHQEIIALYHEVLPELRKVRVWDANREKLLRARWKADSKRQTLDYWRGYFEYVRKCPLLMGLVDGRDGKAPFQADLEWLVRPTNFNKVIEGKYEA